MTESGRESINSVKERGRALGFQTMPHMSVTHVRLRQFRAEQLEALRYPRPDQQTAKQLCPVPQSGPTDTRTAEAPIKHRQDQNNRGQNNKPEGERKRNRDRYARTHKM